MKHADARPAETFGTSHTDSPRAAGPGAAAMVLRVLGLWLALVVLYPVTVVGISSVMLPPHPVELLLLAVLFVAAGAVGTWLLTRVPRVPR